MSTERLFLFVCLLIEPFGIEIDDITDRPPHQQVLLIEPFGIEIPPFWHRQTMPTIF